MIEVLATDFLGSPVKGAVISVQGGPRSDRPVRGRATTDAAGLARFAGLPKSSYWLEAQMAGYSLPTRVRTLEIQGPGARATVKLQLARRPILTGQVVDEQGAPMPDTRIQLFELTTGDGEATVSPSWSTTTDDRGFYRLSVAEPGRYWVMATHMELSFPRGSAPRPTGSVFFPNSPDMLSSLPADLSFDQADTVFDFTLPPAPRTELAAGLLSGRGGWPCAQCAYSVRMIEGDYDYEVIGGSISGGLAGFEYRGIPAGQYRIFVEDQAEDTLGWWAIEEVSLVEDRPVALSIETKPPVALAGGLTLEDPPSEWTAEQRENADAVQVQLTQAGNSFFTVHRTSGTRTQLPPEAAEFALGPLPPGKFRLEVWAQGTDAYLAGVARQGRPLPAPLLDLSQPGDWTNLELRVRFDMARPVIRIPALSTRGQWWTMQRVVLVPDRDQNPFGHTMEGYCGHDGSCDISPVPPGRYWAIVVQQSQGEINFRDLAVRSRLAQWGREIDLTPGENSPIELKPVPQKALDGI
jgi:protocatechuate 3,4-dioxygenase beta subunit